ncbi:hypothetical protein OCF84_20975 (plasmid) [Shewanella xiamenensis]|uniref:Uncharacterized protein n=1 Tax=Shewanella xiamenensis TaxID=332186 RepID=A0ABT6UFK1_9GAMM|nr:hypothetical protein [Shewanella xiamenensis]MDI5833256.1 hypothetical protein [Shewanella xiamenensis]WHF57993.1 hypothetical protein OCF84_20975 [Shewanella xiamenensis]
MKRFLIAAMCLLVPTTHLSAMPARDNIEVFESWRVAHLTQANEYWAYTELDSGHVLAYVASRDSVGPGCEITSIALTSDVLKLPKGKGPITATLSYGLNMERTMNGQLIPSQRRWASMYGLLTIPPSELPDLVRSSYIGSDKSFSILLQQDFKTVATGVGRTFGMRNAYNRVIDLCRQDTNKGEFIPMVGIK